MNEIKITIDGRACSGEQGQTILGIARAHGIEIPTLCHDKRVEMYGSCGLCVVEAEGNAKLLRSCSTYASDGMAIHTNTERIRENRKAALELLLSDHTGDCRAPCAAACPAGTDCQGYVGLIANGEYDEALKLIMEKIPLPASIGRVCPHPCEDACRRELVEEPVSIAVLKQFAGDIALERKGAFAAEIAEPTGKSIAIVGGGPGGLTAAYFLRRKGHAVTVYDAMPHMGGMLRYGIPEYRLPKALLQKEIDAIGNMGVAFRNNVQIGRDVTLDELRTNNDAVIVAAGAWTGTGLGCPGEDLDGVLGGIGFLLDVAVGNAPDFKGKNVAVVGGGNTAMDACRTAVRLGAANVYNIYRRTKNEMPAEEIEIIEADEEGVIFKNLTNPLEIIGEGGRVKTVRLQVMELGEPDASGRRAPVPVKGKEEHIDADFVISAIGQKLNPKGFEGIDLTRWGTIVADEHTFLTNLDGVFAVGDATNNGADIAVAAIGEGKKAADMADRYVRGETLSYTPPYLAETEKTAEDFADKTKEARVRMPHRSGSERRGDFYEINLGISEDAARKEASRCLECGCMDYFECKLIEYANQYAVRPEKYDGMKHDRRQENDHPFISRNPDKCVLCGLCVRICDEVVGVTALSLIDRGFDAIVKPALDMDLRDTDCISCGQCANACPTGALTEVMQGIKQVPVREKFTETVCSFCSVGCKAELASCGSLLTRSVPADGELLCKKGRFGFGELNRRERLAVPLVNGKETAFGQAAAFANQELRKLQTLYGDDCIAVAVSDRYTNEEAFLIKEYAEKALRTHKVFSFNRTVSGVADVLGRDASTAALNDLDGADCIIVVGSDIMRNHGAVGMRIRRAVNRGARLFTMSPEDSLLDSAAFLHYDMSDGLSALREIAAALLKHGYGTEIKGRGELAESLQDVSAESLSAESIKNAFTDKTVFVFEKNAVTRDAARLIADIAVLCGAGIIQLLPGANSQGLADLGIAPAGEFLPEIKDGLIRGLFVFGEDTEIAHAVNFLAVHDVHMTETARAADAVLPAFSFAEVSGTYTSADGRTRELKPAVDSPVAGEARDNIAQILKLAETAGVKLPYKDIGDVRRAMAELPAPAQGAARLTPAEGGALALEYADADALRTGFMAYAAANNC